MSSLEHSDLAVSTVWARSRTMAGAFPPEPAAGARAVLAALDRLGLKRLELEYRLSGPVLGQLLPELAPRGYSVVSLHNFMFMPPDMPHRLASGDLFNLASLDQDQRRLAERYTLKTLELASDLEAEAVVLHLGGVEGLADKEATGEAARAGEKTPALSALLAARAQQAPRHLDAASFCLERLAERAGSLGVVLGLENRYHGFQVPDFAEMGLLLARFQGAPLGLWYDSGHAAVQEAAGLTPARDWLAAYGHSLAGCHLHDARGPQDHLAPGQGELDWPALTQALLDAPLKVLEVADGEDPGPLSEGAELLAGLWARAAEQEREKEARP